MLVQVDRKKFFSVIIKLKSKAKHINDKNLTTQHLVGNTVVGKTCFYLDGKNKTKRFYINKEYINEGVVV